MSELIQYTVSEISFAVKKCVESSFSQVQVKGEIFGAKRADSGHYYLSLKDENAVLAAVCWKGVAATFPFKIEDGMEVVATGRITTFAGKSSYQLVIEHLEVAGEGALLKLLEERKRQFLKEGLFDAAHKKSIPFLPEVIGVVTSPSGAVIRDIIHRVGDRFPTRIIIWPTSVQGEGAAAKIAAAIRGFNNLPSWADGVTQALQAEVQSRGENKILSEQLQNGPEGQSDLGRSGYVPDMLIPRPDVIIVARGGGSLEDLWPFNEEAVIRAVYESKIPVISAVGHETDTMLIDYVSDLRAPTPTGAAEFAVPVKNELLMQLSSLENRRIQAGVRLLNEYKNFVEGMGRGIPNLQQIVQENQQKIDDRGERLKLAMKNFQRQKEQNLELSGLRSYYIRNLAAQKDNILSNLASRLEGVSVEAVLKRGFAWITDRHFNTVYDPVQAKKSGELNVRFADGIVKTKVVENRDAQQFDLFDL